MSKFKEGDDYFVIETSPEGDLQVCLSCWDEMSEDTPLVFETLGEALNYAKNIMLRDRITFYDFTAAHSIELKL